jgi:SAM-dependent methyltransferase
MSSQSDYWNRVAWVKTFTHPLNLRLLSGSVTPQARIVDYGCGYGRLIKQLMALGYKNIVGYDPSQELIRRGKEEDDNLPVFHITDTDRLPEKENSVDCVLLFAVLTCIPSNEGQLALINKLHSVLKPGGILYISDYHLQENLSEVSRYSFYNDDPKNFGVFTLTEGVTFRHHTREWIRTLTSKFKLLKEISLDVHTMNGSPAKAFQMVVQKN